ncbi:MAG TPA: hypothetical protein VF210_18645 [Pseudomonadales bacterium]
MRRSTFIFLWALAALSSPAARAADPHEYIERAVELIEQGQHELARTYLEPALIDYRLNAGERSRAYYIRGYSYYAQGMYVSAYKDYNRALEFNAGNPVVLTAVAQMHLDGQGVEPDPLLGVAFLEQAANAEHAPAMLGLGVAYLRGFGVEQDIEAARQWLERAADAGLADAMLYLGQSYRPPFAEPGDPEAARRWFDKAREAGAADALAHLGFLAAAGAEPDPEAARSFFEQGAEAGSALAQAKLGHMYLTGDGVEKDTARALELFRQAAERQHPSAYMGLAYLYDSGTGVPRDAAQARTWYERAARAGVAEAQLRLAHMAMQQDTPAAQREAGRWLARAAAQNNVQALNDYAWLLATSPFDEVRNGQQALTLALQAVDRDRNPSYLDTLAAAYAETGKFDRAIAVQREALAMVKGEAMLEKELRLHLEAFEEGRPWRE